MTEYYTEQEFNELVKTLVDAVNDFNLVVFVGAGISLSQGYPNWNGYVEKLIHFWQFNIRNFTEAEGKITNKLLSQFDQILRSENTNKRKIDLLHTLLEKILGEKFKETKLAFEEYFFDNVLPDSPENKILVELMKLDPIFITSNYDFEIEEHLKRSKQKGSFRPINNIREFIKSDKVLQSGDVLHLHGTTKGDWGLFVNATIDYTRQYLRNTEDFKNLSRWFEEKEPVVLFIGSSMEEEEILSLLPVTTKNYALMKANSEESREFRDIYNQTYQKNNATTIFWYGDSYGDLPKKIKEIINAVQKELKIPKSLDDWYLLHTISLDDKEYQEVFERHSEEPKFLFDMFKAEDINLQKKILTNTLGSKILVEKAVNISSFWNMLNTNFESLNLKETRTIIEIFQEQKLNIHWNEIFDIFEKIKKDEETVSADMQKIGEKLSKNYELIGTSFSNDEDLMGYWLFEQLQQGYSYHRDMYFKKDKIYSINLRSEMISSIVDVTNEMNYRYSSFKELVSDDLIQIIYTSLINNSIFLEGLSIWDNFPNKLLESRLFQRILVKLDKQKTLKNVLLDDLINHIDFSDSIFGTELNDFVSKYKSKITELGKEPLAKYKDGFGEIEGGTVREKSFIDRNEIISNNIDSIIQILLPEKNEERGFYEDFLVEKTYSATSHFLIDALKTNDETSEKIRKVILSKGAKLFEKYESMFITILIDDDFDQGIKDEVLKIQLENFNLATFSFEKKNLFDYFINNERFDSPLFNKLLKVSVNDLDKKYIYTDKTRPELLEINDFINTELGRYLDILIKLARKDKSKVYDIRILIDSITSSEFKDFSKGALYSVYNYLETEQITINTFEGYSYSLRGFREEDLSKFSSVGKYILKKGYVSDFNKANLFVLSLHMINPKENEINWNEINFSNLLTIILSSEFNYTYEKEWVEEIIIHDIDGKYGRDILQFFGYKESQFEKLNMINEIFNKCIDSYAAKINIGLLPITVKELSDSLVKELLINLFFLLLDNSKISEEYFGSKTLVDLMKHMDSDLQKKLANHPNLGSVLSPLEIEDLKREIL